MTTFPTDLSVPFSPRARWLADVLKRVVARHAARRMYRATVSDLVALDDHLLRDVGLTRDAIRDVAASGATQAFAKWRTTGSATF